MTTYVARPFVCFWRRRRQFYRIVEDLSGRPSDSDKMLPLITVYLYLTLWEIASPSEPSLTATSPARPVGLSPTSRLLTCHHLWALQHWNVATRTQAFLRFLHHLCKHSVDSQPGLAPSLALTSTSHLRFTFPASLPTWTGKSLLANRLFEDLLETHRGPHSFVITSIDIQNLK